MEIRSTRTECQTMGHDGCKRWSAKHPSGYWKTYKIVHNVYNRQITETIKD